MRAGWSTAQFCCVPSLHSIPASHMHCLTYSASHAVPHSAAQCWVIESHLISHPAPETAPIPPDWTCTRLWGGPALNVTPMPSGSGCTASCPSCATPTEPPCCASWGTTAARTAPAHRGPPSTFKSSSPMERWVGWGSVRCGGVGGRPDVAAVVLGMQCKGLPNLSPAPAPKVAAHSPLPPPPIAHRFVQVFSYRRAGTAMAAAGFHMRTGCTCNPGACYGGAQGAGMEGSWGPPLHGCPHRVWRTVPHASAWLRTAAHACWCTGSQGLPPTTSKSLLVLP